jgi:hypothetical protein
MELQYHRTAFELLQSEPVFSRKAGKQLDSVQKAIGFPLPQSIREWYSLEDAVERLQLLDEAYSFEPFGIAHNAKYLKKAAHREHHTWVVGAYPSGVCFAASFPGEQDPLVRCIEPDGSYIDDADEWTNRTFSAFVFTCCWYNLLHSRKTVAGTAPNFSPAQLDMLIELFDEGPRVMRRDAAPTRSHPITRERGIPVYRFQFFFFSSSGMLRLLSQHDPTVSQVDVKWELSCPDEPTLLTLTSQLKARGVLPQ